MPKTLYFATHNKNKSKEVQELLSGKYVVKNLLDLNLQEDIAETGETLLENASLKAAYLRNKTGMAAFADDTGLEVDALDGSPGVFSARYAGYEATAEDNMTKLLVNLKDAKVRTARFRTVIAYVSEFGAEFFFEGVVEGVILDEKVGKDGFGYDPIFKPLGFDKSFAEMTMKEKGLISHRAKALQKFVDFLQGV